MAWKHYEPWTNGKTCIIDGDYAIDTPFEMGAVTTGRQRVFHRYYIRVDMLDGSVLTGEDEGSVRAALFALDRVCRASGLALLVAGLDDSFRESGCSANSGFGYCPEVDRAVHMMELPVLKDRDPENEQFVEALVRVAVDGMFSEASQQKSLN